MKVTNNKSSHNNNNNNKRHFFFFFLHLFLKYRDANRHYLQHNPHTPLRLVKRSVMKSMGPAAGLGGPPLTWSAVAVRAVVVTLA